MAIMSPYRRRVPAEAAVLGAWRSGTTTRANDCGTAMNSADGPSTKTVNRCSDGCSASAVKSPRVKRPNPRRFARQLPSIPIFMKDL
jgi:hypothetical protein